MHKHGRYGADCFYIGKQYPDYAYIEKYLSAIQKAHVAINDMGFSTFIYPVQYTLSRTQGDIHFSSQVKEIVSQRCGEGLPSASASS